MQVEQWIMIASSRHNLCFADSLSRPRFPKLQHKQMMPELLQSYPSVCSFHLLYLAFNLFNFRQEEVTGVHNVNVFSIKSKWM